LSWQGQPQGRDTAGRPTAIEIVVLPEDVVPDG